MTIIEYGSQDYMELKSHVVAGILLTQVWRPNGNVGIVSGGKKREGDRTNDDEPRIFKRYSRYRLLLSLSLSLRLSVRMIYM